LEKKIFSIKEIKFFWIINYNLPIPRPPERTSKLQKKPSALKRKHLALQNMKFLIFFLFLWVIFSLLDPDPDFEYPVSTDLIESGSNPDPDPNHCYGYLTCPYSFKIKTVISL
jgi:hypothetical protein